MGRVDGYLRSARPGCGAEASSGDATLAVSSLQLIGLMSWK
jgi:hypothetical protein